MYPSPFRVLVVQHYKENLKKCTVTPLRNRPDLEIRIIRPDPSGYPPLEISGGILLAVGAPPLSPEDRAHLEAAGERRLVVIDANWAKVPVILRALRPREPLVRRSLGAGILTAYPRRSKLHEDPPEGLATVEAIAAALAILGAPDLSLFEGYPWAREFLDLNRGLLGGAESPAG